MRFFVITLLVLFLSPVCIAYGQNKVDIDNVNNMVQQQQYFAALKLVSPCLSANSVKEISNLEECLYKGEKIAIEAVSELSSKYWKMSDDLEKSTTNGNQSFYIKREELLKALRQSYLDLGISTRYNEIVNEFIYSHEFFKSLHEKFPNSKYQEEVEYILIDSEASVNDWQQWISKLETYIKRYPTGRYSLKARVNLARNYGDLWNLMLPEHDWSFLVVEFPKDAKLANIYRQKALAVYNAILSLPDKSSLSEQELTNIKKEISDLKMNRASSGMSILRGYD
jgi:hypothetical protein